MLLFTLTTLDPSLGGIARSVPRLALALAEIGASVGVVALRSERMTFDLTAEKRFEHCELVDTPRQAARVVDGLCRAGKVTTLYNVGIWIPLNHAINRLARKHSIPVIISPRSMLDPWAMQHRRWKKQLAWWLYAKQDLNQATALHTTADLETQIVRDLGYKGKVIMVPNGVGSCELGVESCEEGVESCELGVESCELGEGSCELGVERCDVEDQKPETLSIRRSLKGEGGSNQQPSTKNKAPSTLNQEPRTKNPPTQQLNNPQRSALLFLSRIHPKKGLLDLITCFGQLQPAGWKLIIAGNDDGGHRAECERLALAQPNAGDIEFLGELDDSEKWQTYHAADLFVLPSYSENFGLVIGEALAAGLPVITTTATPWTELDQRQCGWCIKPGKESLKKALTTALQTSKEQRQQMGERGAKWVKEEFQWNAVARRFWGLVASC